MAPLLLLPIQYWSLIPYNLHYVDQKPGVLHPAHKQNHLVKLIQLWQLLNFCTSINIYDKKFWVTISFQILGTWGSNTDSWWEETPCKILKNLVCPIITAFFQYMIAIFPALVLSSHMFRSISASCCFIKGWKKQVYKYFAPCKVLI